MNEMVGVIIEEGQTIRLTPMEHVSLLLRSRNYCKRFQRSKYELYHYNGPASTLILETNSKEELLVTMDALNLKFFKKHRSTLFSHTTNGKYKLFAYCSVELTEK